MSNFRPVLVPLAALILAALPSQAFAQAEMLRSARDAWSRMQSGQSPKSVSVAAAGENDSWGDSAPSRSDGAKRTAARPADERDRDDRLGAPRRAAAAAIPRVGEVPVVRVKPAAASKRTVQTERGEYSTDQADVRPRASPKVRRSAEDRANGVSADDRAAPIAQSNGGSCANVSRAWQGAAAIAARGEEQRAYDAYLRLLSSCTDEKELVGTVYQAQKFLSAKSLEQLLQEPVMEAPKLQSAMLALKLQRMYAANKARDAETALALSREIRATVLESGDAGALEVSGWLEQRAKNTKASEPLFRAALKVNRDSNSARQGLVYALLAQGKVEAAAREAERLEGATADEVRADVLIAQARVSLKDSQFTDAITKLDMAERLGLDVDDSMIETRAWALKGLGHADKAAKLFAPLLRRAPDNADLQTGLVDSLYAAHDDKGLQTLAAQGASVAAAATEALSRRMDGQGRRGEVAEGEKSYARTDIQVRSKSGDKSQGRLIPTTALSTEATVRVSDATTVSVSAVRRELDDGVNRTVVTELRLRNSTTLGAGMVGQTSPGYTDVAVPLEGRAKLNSADRSPFKVQ